MSDAVPNSSSEDRSRDSAGNWASLFQHSTQAVFLLSPRRRFRYVNHVWERLTGQSTESILGKICKARATLEPDPPQRVANALLPPAEVFDGHSATVRRPVPGQSNGPPWWDVSYLPLKGADGLLGILGTITHIGEPVRAALGKGLPDSLIDLRRRAASEYSFELLLSDRPARQRIAEQARIAAKSRHPVWIVGAKGSGKDTLARIIHFQGITREQSFLPIDCAGLQPYLIRGMLFGKTGFAETGRIGTLYLKNAHALPGDLQRELLDWLDQQSLPSRVIVEYHEARHPLEDSRFLPEFATRLSVFEIRTLPLGVPEMVEGLRSFVQRMMEQEGFKIGLHPEVWASSKSTIGRRTSTNCGKRCGQAPWHPAATQSK